MKQQQTLMRFDPATGDSTPYPSHAAQWREFNGEMAWLFNPWNGERRHAGDVGSDRFGHLILPPGEPVYAEAKPVAYYDPKAETFMFPPKDGARPFAKAWKPLYAGA